MSMVKQIGYDDLSSDLFEIEPNSDVLRWERAFVPRPNTNLEKVRAKFQAGIPEIQDYSVRLIPKHAKRNRGDSAKLLIIYTTQGQIGKRFNNSQWFSLQF